jgi:tRNA nucleotidyltransferase/poly(A) polymerase
MIPFNKDILPEAKGTYIVGGTVRDLLLHRTPTDYDIVVTKDPENFAIKMAQRTKGHVIQLGKPGQTTLRVASGDKIFDITSLNGKSIEDDLKKRDFTINAMAYHVYSEEIIDCLGGLQDLADKTVRMVSRKIFINDPVRLIRAYRIAAHLNFRIESQTASTIKSDAKLIHNSAGERIRVELFSMLGTSKSYDYLSQMDSSGLLTEILPDLAPLKGCLQNRHHLYDAFEHTLKAYDHLEILLNDLKIVLPDTFAQIRQYVQKNRPALMKCAILLHDIGKPRVKSTDSNGRTHFYGHARKSADLARKISRKLRFSNHEKQFIDFIIRNHMRPLFLFTAHEKKTLTPKSITRFYKKCGDNTPALLLHAIADIKAKQNRTDQKNIALISFFKKMIYDFFYRFKPRINEPPLITGRDLIEIFGLSPSPLFKTILDRVDEAKLTDTIKNRTEALALAKEYLEDISKPSGE